MNRFYFAGLSLVLAGAFSGSAYGIDNLPFPSPSTPVMIPSEHLLCLVKVKKKEYICDLPVSLGSLDSGCSCIVNNNLVHGYVIYKGN